MRAGEKQVLTGVVEVLVLVVVVLLVLPKTNPLVVGAVVVVVVVLLLLLFGAPNTKPMGLLVVGAVVVDGANTNPE